MNNKKVLTLALAALVFAGSTTLFGTIAKADTINAKGLTTSSIASPMTAGIVIVTSTSGAYIRSGAGTSYSIVTTANYGEELGYSNLSKADSSGVTWYYVTKLSNGVPTSTTGWISSAVSKAG